MSSNIFRASPSSSQSSSQSSPAAAVSWMGLVEVQLSMALDLANDPDAGASPTPSRLREALRAAVFPGGHRLRPRLCLEVASALLAEQRGVFAEAPRPPELVIALCAALELIHSASLVHDDLRCFDDAPMRRGRPSVQAAFGEPLAVLAGDGLITLAFETLARASVSSDEPVVGAHLVVLLARAAGPRGGLVAGQALELEPLSPRDWSPYHRAKTATLFELASWGAALALRAPEEPWRSIGRALGEAYQLADDLLDAGATFKSREAGKPLGQDAIHGRPSAVASLGANHVKKAFHAKVERAVELVPSEAAGFRAWIRSTFPPLGASR